MRIVSVLLVVISVSFLWAADFWVSKDYTSWTQKECETLLTKSPWVFTNSFFQVNNYGPLSSGGNQAEPERTVTFWFRSLSAKPIRMAFGQLQLLKKPGDTAVADQMKQTIETPPDENNRIVLQIDFSVKPAGGSTLRDIHSFLLNAHFPNFRDNTYLSSSKKGNIPLLEYRAPSPKQSNAVFIFPRVDEKGEPYFDGSEKWISLRSEIGTYKVYARNPVEKMKFQGTFEF